MCRHARLLTVCLACLLFSAHTYGLEEEKSQIDGSCDMNQLFEAHSSNGSLSKQGLDKILKTISVICRQTKANETLTPHQHLPKPNESINYKAWLYGCLSVLFISGCGFVAVAVIKILPKWLEQPAIQFLVSLAVGTLMGDAVLHLIPHAYIPAHHVDHPSDLPEEHDHDEQDHDHDTTIIWKGLVVLVVVALFFLIERTLNIYGEWRQRLQAEQQADKVANLLSGSSKMVGEKLCQHRQHSHKGHQHYQQDCELAELQKPLNEPAPDTDVLVVNCDKDPSVKAGATAAENGGGGGGCSEWQGLLVGQPLIYCTSHEICDGSDATVDATKRMPIDSDHLVSVNIKPKAASGEAASSAATEDRVFISEHHTSHHGHSHSHGHIHARPEGGFASLAWLVLAGDGLHNLSDGLAIGGAFGSSITGGFTTALAVLFHELPHELGDFAVLLKAGMTIKQALICNLISSILCLVGVMVGLAIGSSYDIAPWIFACTAGMFLYIALVDMMPELNGRMNNHSALLQLLLQVAGMATGVSIMLTIALYEHEFERMLKSSY